MMCSPRREDVGRFELKLDSGAAATPVAVLSALSADAGALTFGSCGLSGWVWVMEGRKVHLYDSSLASPSAHTLPLPAAGLPYTPRLVGLLHSRAALPGLLAASPEGHLRFWPSLAIPTRYSQLTVELSGQVVHSLQRLGDSRAFLLATTTGRLVFVSVNDAGTALRATEMRSSEEGLVSGVTRRLTSLLWASGPGGNGERRRLVRVLAKEGGAWLVEAGGGLEEWWLGDDVEETGSFQDRLALKPIIEDAMMEELWHLSSAAAKAEYRPHLRTFVLDALNWGPNGLLILIAAANSAISKEIHFAIGVIDEPGSDSKQFDHFCQLNLAMENFTMGSESALDGVCLVGPCGGIEPRELRTTTLLLVSRRCVSAMRLRLADNRLSIQESHSLHIAAENTILGSGWLPDNGAIFMRKSGMRLVRLVPRGMDSGGLDVSQLGTPSRRRGAAICEEDEEDEDDEEDEASATFRRAFVAFTQQREAEAGRLVEELERCGADLSALSAALSFDICNDYPQNDPRWTSKLPPKTSRSSSLLLSIQLEDKVRTLSLLGGFLDTLGLWERLGPVSVGQRTWPSVLAVMREHGEKLTVGLALVRAFDPKAAVRPQALEEAIRRIVHERRDEEEGAKLTPPDLFFRNASDLNEIFPKLVTVTKFLVAEMGKSDSQEKDAILPTIKSTMSLMSWSLEAIAKRRSERSRWWTREGTGRGDGKQWPWLLHSSVRDPLVALVGWGLGAAEDGGDDGGAILHLAETIADLYLNFFAAFAAKAGKDDDWGRRVNQELINTSSLFIQPFYTRKDQSALRRALALAEKHRDVASLIQLSERLPREEREDLRREWKRRFEAEGFPAQLYAHLYSRGAVAELLNEGAAELEEWDGTTAGERDFRQFLRPHPELRWQHEVRAQDFGDAAATLMRLGEAETTSAAKREVFASLAKLAAVEAGQDCAEAELLLQLAQHQKRLVGVDPLSADWGRADAAPLSADQLIQSRLAAPSATSTDFVAALDVLSCWRRLGSPGSEWGARIWTAVLGSEGWERWADIAEAGASKAALGTHYARTLGELVALNVDQGLVPDADALLRRPDIPQALRDDAAFQHILRSSEEKARRALDATRANSEM